MINQSSPGFASAPAIFWFHLVALCPGSLLTINAHRFFSGDESFGNAAQDSGIKIAAEASPGRRTAERL